jgi:perosamine synthetase
VEPLAIQGGKPVRDSLLSYGHQWIDDDDIAAVTRVLKSDWLTQGPKVDEFEKNVADYCGARYGIALSNGTTALHAACVVAGISPGDEAIVTPLTFAATANAVVYCSGKPVFADIQEDNLNIDPEQIITRITPRTKVILPVDFAGHPADMDEIRTIAESKKLTVIEDACHALGAVYKNKKVGSLADMTVFSFHPVKHITTGEGGMVLTDNSDFCQRLKVFRHHGIVKDDPSQGAWHYRIHQMGHNFRLTDFQCALGLSQMKKLDAFLERRRVIACRYDQALSGLAEVKIIYNKPDIKHAYHIYVIQLRPETLSAGRKEIFDALRAENIGVNVHYMPLHMHPFYQNQFNYKAGDYPIAEKYYSHAITLPIFPAMNDKDIDNVIEAVIKVITYYRNKPVEKIK